MPGAMARPGLDAVDLGAERSLLVTGDGVHARAEEQEEEQQALHQNATSSVVTNRPASRLLT